MQLTKKLAVPFALALVLFGQSSICQKRQKLPTILGVNPTLSELLTWLKTTGFPQARLKFNSRWFYSSNHHRDMDELYESDDLGFQGIDWIDLLFDKGFNLADVTGCRLTLRNDDIRIANQKNGSYNRQLIVFPAGKAAVPLPAHYALLYIPLDRMTDSGGRSPYLLSNDAQKRNLLGSWRVQYKKRGFFSNTIVDLEVFANDQRQTHLVGSDELLTLTFDQRQIAQDFDNAFRSAIKMCRPKR